MTSIADIPDRAPSRMGLSRSPFTGSGASMDIFCRAASSSDSATDDSSSEEEDEEFIQSFLPPMVTTRSVDSDDEDDGDHELYGPPSPPPPTPRIEISMLPDATPPPLALWSIGGSFDEDDDVWSTDDEPSVSSTTIYTHARDTRATLPTIREEDETAAHPPVAQLVALPIGIVRPIPIIPDDAFFRPAAPPNHGRSYAAHTQFKRFWHHRQDVWRREERVRTNAAYGGIAVSPQLGSLGGFATSTARLPPAIPGRRSALFAPPPVSPATHPRLFPRLGALAPSDALSLGQDLCAADRAFWALPVPTVRKLLYINEMLAMQARGRVSPTGSDDSEETLVDEIESRSRSVFDKRCQGDADDKIEEDITVAATRVAVC